MIVHRYALFTATTFAGLLSLGLQSFAGGPSPISPRARAAAAAAAQGPAVPAAAAAAPEPSRIRVKYREGPQAASAAAGAPDVNMSISQLGDARVQSSVPGAGNTETKVLDRALSEQELGRIAEGISRNPRVEWAVPEKIERIQQVNDPLYASQWHYHQDKVGIRVPQAWDRSTGQDVIVAVIDTGIRNHVDIADQLLPGFDFVANTQSSNDGDGRDADPTDPGDWCRFDINPVSSWHGLHVAGTVAATTNNGLGVAGVARSAKILPIRVLGQCGGSSFDITDGIRWAAGLAVPGAPINPRPARVINLSLGGPGPCDADYADAIRQARARGVTVVVAAGNSDSDARDFRPANCEGVISVAATNPEGARANFGGPGAGSNFGASVKIAAPGGEAFADLSRGIVSTLNDGIRGPGNDSYEAYQGTSMAAPHVAGVVALLYQILPNITPDEVLSVIQATSQPFPKVTSRQCEPSICGAGIIDAEAALVEALNRATQIAAASPSGAGLGTGSGASATGVQPSSAPKARP